MRRAIAYIDGFNLYYGIRSLNNPALKIHSSKLTIIEGHFWKKSTNCHNCGYYNQTYEKKKTDVNISLRDVGGCI